MAKKKRYVGKVSGRGQSLFVSGSASSFFDDLSLYLAVEFPEEVDKALASTAFFTMKAMKSEFPRFGRSLGAPSKLQERRWYDKQNDNSPSGTKKFYGANYSRSHGLGRAFQYRKYTGKAVVGWLDSSAVRFADRWATRGTKRVDRRMHEKYKAAAEQAGKAWPYQVRTRRNRSRKTGSKFMVIGKGLIVPREGAVLPTRSNGPSNIQYIDHFQRKYEGAIINAFRGKVEEKLNLRFRGSTESTIKADFDAAARGASVKARNFSVDAINNLINAQINKIVKKGLAI